jgi:hypothetical protein
MGSARTRRLSQRAATLLEPEAAPTLAELDELLTDCAAEALALRAEALRVNRQMAGQLLDAADDPARAAEAQRLAMREERLSREWDEVARLLGELRGRRAAASASQAGSAKH